MRPGDVKSTGTEETPESGSPADPQTGSRRERRRQARARHETEAPAAPPTRVVQSKSSIHPKATLPGKPGTHSTPAAPPKAPEPVNPTPVVKRAESSKPVPATQPIQPVQPVTTFDDLNLDDEHVLNEQVLNDDEESQEDQTSAAEGMTAIEWLENPSTVPAATVPAATSAREAVSTQNSAHVVTLERELIEKEELIVALTDRLERAAEQLDRQRRSGVTMHRGGGGGSGLPAELVEDHRSTIDELKQTINRWEEMQCGAALGRMEMQLVELRDLVANLSSGNVVAHGRDSHDSGSHSSRSHAGSTPGSGAHSEANPAQGKPGSAWWEATKAALLSGDEAPPMPEATASPHARAESVALNGDDPLPEIPEPIDYDELTLEEACQRLRERDAIIAQFHDRILIQQAAAEFPDQGSLDSLSEPLRERLMALEAQWQAKFRQAELDLSLERARLARTASMLSQQQHQVDQGLAREATALDDEARGNHSKSDKRWFKFFGKNEQQ